MTPLAQRVVNNRFLPFKDRVFEDNVGVSRMMDDVHCFECTEVLEAAKSLAVSMNRPGGIPENTSFLPAPKTWIEWQEKGLRKGLLLIQEEIDAKAFWVFGEKHHMESMDGGHLRLLSDRTDRQPPVFMEYHSGDFPPFVDAALLAMINTPRVIGRVQRPPHSGLQRRLAAANGMTGKYPLLNWTEIKLHVTPPSPGDGEQTQQRLTGAKALHFCRMHLRVRLGKIELVKAHWRGDASVGITQSHYSVASPSRPGGVG